MPTKEQNERRKRKQTFQHHFLYIQYKNLQNKGVKYTTYNLLYYTTGTYHGERKDNHDPMANKEDTQH